MALNDSYMYPASDLTLEKVVRDRNSRTGAALRELIGTSDGGEGGGLSPDEVKSLAKEVGDTSYVTLEAGAGLSQVVDTKVSKEVADRTYAAQVKDAVLTRDSAGRIMSAVENGVTVTYTRDSQGRIATETRNGKTTTYTRDGAGRVSGWATV